MEYVVSEALKQLVSTNCYQSKEGERAGKFNQIQNFVGQQTNNGWFRAKIKKSFFRPFPLPSPLQRREQGGHACQACPTHRVCPSQQRDHVNMVIYFTI